ncbi:hypothetical protein SLA2020_018080 [Shorea laevis]
MLHNSGELCSLGMSKTKLCVLLGCFFLSSALVGAQSFKTHPDEVSALQTIKKSLIDPKKNLANWKRGDPCTSNWTGVLCYNTTLDDGYLHVTELHLLNMNLSGTLSPALGRLSGLSILDFMWNNISGSIPKEIGNIKTLELLLLNGNHLTGSLPDDLGYLPKLDRIQIDENKISGPIPTSFANLNKTKHFHMNNNSISGQIPSELSKLPYLQHFLLDNNNLSGHLPQELAQMPNLTILQLDNNNFQGTSIPGSFGNITKLLKLSLRNCKLQGSVPDLSRIPNLGYLDLSLNQLSGPIPTNKLSESITTIDLSNNSLTGSIPANFFGLPNLQKLDLSNNNLTGSIPASFFGLPNLQKLDLSNNNLTGSIPASFFGLPNLQKLDLENNNLVNISGNSDLPPNVMPWLHGNPICKNRSLVQSCKSQTENETRESTATNSTTTECKLQSCRYQISPLDCFCAKPLLIGYRLKSPGFSYFLPYKQPLMEHLTQHLNLSIRQLYIYSFAWQGPRLGMYLKLYPVSDNTTNNPLFNPSEVQQIESMFTGWKIPLHGTFGPAELINFTLSDVYKAASRALLKIDGVKSFTYGELALATNNFDFFTQIGQGGYGKVYKGTLVDGTIVAIKRAQQGSLQGEKEFLTEIQLLSRLHHRNLVSLVGYCDEEGEQMLVYEYMSNGTLRDHLSGKIKEPLSFARRLRIALGSSKGILYLHTEADPPIFHRDIKSSNILLDSKFVAKVADFGLSRLAPVLDIEGAALAYVSTVVKGTPGYLDPEYFLTHKLTDKSDVYSLGVVFLELLTGMHPISHAKTLFERMGSYPSECVEKFVNLAMKCCQDETDSRPSMAEVVRTLETIGLMMPRYSDPLFEESMEGDPEKTSTAPPLSSSEVKNLYTSSYVFGSDLVSGVIPTITPK